ncbi:MAG: hypothetical protein ACQESK_09720 [Bacteroidota bacterium]
MVQVIVLKLIQLTSFNFKPSKYKNFNLLYFIPCIFVASNDVFDQINALFFRIFKGQMINYKEYNSFLITLGYVVFGMQRLFELSNWWVYISLLIWLSALPFGFVVIKNQLQTRFRLSHTWMYFINLILILFIVLVVFQLKS